MINDGVAHLMDHNRVRDIFFGGIYSLASMDIKRLKVLRNVKYFVIFIIQLSLVVKNLYHDLINAWMHIKNILRFVKQHVQPVCHLAFYISAVIALSFTKIEPPLPKVPFDSS